MTTAGRRLDFHGHNRLVFFAREPEVLLCGPAGTGKTTAWLAKLFLAAERYPGMRGLIVRKTRESLTEAALVTWEQKVVPAGHASLAGPRRRLRQAYRFPNGAEVIVGGLDKASKVMSTEFDIIYVQEAIELGEADWGALTTRLRNGRMPYQQLVGDTNPDRPTHWLKRRCDAGACRMIASRHRDNPAVCDPATGEPTPAGRLYLAKLDALPGVLRGRLRDGLWLQAEGVVYDRFDPAVHLVRRADLPAGWRDWPRVWSVDFGFVNPFVWGCWAIDPDGRLWLVREVYRTRLLVEDAARLILAATVGDPAPDAVVCDHDAEDRATLERHLGRPTRAADKVVRPGVEAVSARLAPSGDGRPRLFVCRDALEHPPDPALSAAGKPTRTAAEFDGYVWRFDPSGKDEPLKVCDHGMDQARYAVMWADARDRLGAAVYGAEPAAPLADLPAGVFAAGGPYS